MLQGFWWDNVKGSDHSLKDLGVVERTSLMRCRWCARDVVQHWDRWPLLWM